MRSLKDLLAQQRDITPVDISLVKDVFERGILKLRRKASFEEDQDRKLRMLGIIEAFEKIISYINDGNFPKARFTLLDFPNPDVRDFLLQLMPSMDTKLALDRVMLFNGIKFHQRIPKKVNIMEQEMTPTPRRSRQIKDRSGRGIVAWTGGSRPPKNLPPEVSSLAKELYAEQLQDWHDYWGDWPDADTKKIFKGRAIYDAWSTYRSKHGDELGENAAGGAGGGGAVAAGSVAAYPSRLFSRPKILKRKTKVGEIPVIRYHNESVGEIPLKESLMSKLLTEYMGSGKFNPADVQSKLDSAEKRLDFQRNSVPFGLKDEKGQIVVVYVRPDQADDFENVVSAELNRTDSTPTEIAELLFNLARGGPEGHGRFDIIHAEFPAVPEDQEEPAGAPGAAPGATPGAAAPGAAPAAGGEDAGELPDLNAGGEGLPPMGDDMGAMGGGGESEAASALDKVIDMLRADIDARKAEAEAAKAKANAEEAKYAADLANSKIRSEQEVLDAEAYYKGQKSEQNEAKKLGLLAKYRNDVARDAEDGMARGQF